MILFRTYKEQMGLIQEEQKKQEQNEQFLKESIEKKAQVFKDNPELKLKHKDLRKNPVTGAELPIYHAYRQIFRQGSQKANIIPLWRYNYDAFYTWSLEQRNGNDSNYNIVLQRIDRKQPYSPENCRWVTKEDRLTAQHRTLTYKGITLPTKEWARLLNLQYPFNNSFYKLLKKFNRDLKKIMDYIINEGHGQDSNRFRKYKPRTLKQALAIYKAEQEEKKLWTILENDQKIKDD